MRFLAVVSLAMSCMLGVIVSPVQAQEKRIALVIGNQDYKPAVGGLDNPHNDISIVGNALTQVGFNLLAPRKDATREEMLIAVHQLAEELRKAGRGAISFLYYSGHGVAVGRENVLLRRVIRADAEGLNAPAGLLADFFRSRRAVSFTQVWDVSPLVASVSADPHMHREGVGRPSDVAPGFLPGHLLNLQHHQSALQPRQIMRVPPAVPGEVSSAE